MRFFVVTPVLNGAGKIGRTVASIVGQTSVVSGDDSLHYLIMDGGSSDATLAEARAAGGDAIEIQSGEDSGLYDALSRALPQSDGDITFYLGAGDVLEPTAFQVVSTIFREYPEVRWLTGRATARNSRQEVVNSVLPQARQARVRVIQAIVCVNPPNLLSTPGGSNSAYRRHHAKPRPHPRRFRPSRLTGRHHRSWRNLST